MTQKEAVYEYMKERGTITTYEAFIELGVTRLAAKIHELKDEGVEIRSKDIVVPTRYGRKTSVREYSIVE